MGKAKNGLVSILQILGKIMDVNDSLMRALKQIMEMFGIREEEVFEQKRIACTQKKLQTESLIKFLYAAVVILNRTAC